MKVCDSEKLFQFAGQRPKQTETVSFRKKWYQGKPLLSIGILGVIILGCVFAELVMTKDPTYMDLLHYNQAPDREFLFGTDTMGRDIFSMIWYGGRISLLIGFLSTAISTVIAIVIGALSGVAPSWLDELLMRFTEIFLSIPSLLLVILLQAILGNASVLTLSIVIGVTSWTSIAKVVRTEVLQLRSSEYVIASRCMGRRIFPYSLESSGTEFCIFDHVYGHYECAECDPVRIDTEFYGNRTSTGNHFLGKHAFTGRKSADDRFMVDHSDSGHFFGSDTAVSDEYRKLSEKERKSKRKQPLKEIDHRILLRYLPFKI